MPKRRLTYDEMARIEDEKVAQGHEAEGYMRVNATVAKEVGHVMMLRFSPAEMALISKRAKASGLDEAQYVRQAVLKTLEG